MKRRLARSATRGLRGLRDQAPQDGQPVGTLAAEIGRHEATVRAWAAWGTHPALGRRVRSGIGPYEIAVSDGRRRLWRGLLVSRADVRACDDAARHPLHRPFPGNSGAWIADGVFRHHDDRLYFTERYVYANRPKFGLAPRTLCLSCYRRRLDSLTVTWPGPGPHDPWTVRVYSEESLDRLAARRRGEEGGGEWVVPGGIWQDAEGRWFSSVHVARQTGLSVRVMHRLLRASGMVGRFKRVPLSNRKGGCSPVVHHESEVGPLLGIGATPAPTKRGRRPSLAAAAKRKFCYERYEQGRREGVSWEEIGKLFGREFGTEPLTGYDACSEARRHAFAHDPPLPWPLRQPG